MVNMSTSSVNLFLHCASLTLACILAARQKSVVKFEEQGAFSVAYQCKSKFRPLKITCTCTCILMSSVKMRAVDSSVQWREEWLLVSVLN